MNIIRRMHLSFGSRVEQLALQFENHDAISEAVLKETHVMAARARTQLARVVRDGAVLRQRLQTLQEEEKRWAERAIQSAENDRSKALECIKRREACRRGIAETENTLVRHTAQEHDLAAAVERIERRVRELTQQRNLLRSRHSAADAQRVIESLEGSSAHGIEDLFERWEMKIAESEYASPLAPRDDAFTTEFVGQEESAALAQSLDALLAHARAGE